MSEAALKALEEIMDVLCHHLGPQVLDQDIASDIDIDRHDDFRNEMREVAADILAVPTLRAALSPAPSTDDDIAAPTGMDGADWASAFRRTAIALGYSDMDEGWLIGWFCNAIMAGFDEATQRALSPAPVGDAEIEAIRAEASRIQSEMDFAISKGIGHPKFDGQAKMLPIVSTLLSRVDALAAELAEAKEELSTWQSVFPDIAPSNVQPDRSLLEAELAAERERGERMREALARCANALEHTYGRVEYPATEDCAENVALRAARAALEGGA